MNRQKIEGVPDHLKLIGFNRLNEGDRYIDLDCLNAMDVLNWEDDLSDFHYAQVEPDNIYGVYDLADVKIPAGYEFVEFRDVATGEQYRDSRSELISTRGSGHLLTGEDKRRIIVKPIAKKTRRVLVVECEIESQLAAYDVSVWSKDFNSPFGVSVPLPINMKRIEEREVA